jgi:hypothetical protein
VSPYRNRVRGRTKRGVVASPTMRGTMEVFLIRRPEKGNQEFGECIPLLSKELCPVRRRPELVAPSRANAL